MHIIDIFAFVWLSTFVCACCMLCYEIHIEKIEKIKKEINITFPSMDGASSSINLKNFWKKDAYHHEPLINDVELGPNDGSSSGLTPPRWVNEV